MSHCHQRCAMRSLFTLLRAVASRVGAAALLAWGLGTQPGHGEHYEIE